MLVEPRTASRLHIMCKISKDITTPLYHNIREVTIPSSAIESDIRKISRRKKDESKFGQCKYKKGHHVKE